MPSGSFYASFVAGLGLFLFAMTELESALSDLAGGSMRGLLRRSTRTPFHGILSGVVVTAVLQSSSVVLLMVLAFVGAGVLTPVHALGVVLGANLGTTFTGWIVATLGFKVQLEALSLPLVGLGALAVVFLRSGTRTRDAGRAVLGLGLLLLGLTYMKVGIDALQGVVDVGRLAGYPLLVYALVGALFTAVIQSSSATMMVALSALSTGIVSLHGAAALMVGADLGTTSTALLGAAGGSAEKKRVALAHFLINVVTAGVAFPLITPLLALARVLGAGDPLYALVAFHSTFNLLGILFFLPVLEPFSRFLESRFRELREHASEFIAKVPSTVPDSALDALELETTHLLSRVMRHNLAPFHSSARFAPPMALSEPERSFLATRSEMDEYSVLKLLEGEILDYATELQRQPLSAEAATRLTAEIVAVRHALQSAKSIKDITHNLTAYLREGLDEARRVRETGSRLAATYQEMTELWRMAGDTVRFEKLAGLLTENRAHYEAGLRSVHQQLAEDRLGPQEVSTALNINRELYSSTKALIEGIGWHLLEPTAAEHLEALPSVSA